MTFRELFTRIRYKNFLWDRTLDFLPPEMIIRRSGLSAKALFRTQADLRGAVLYIQEVVGSEDADFSIRVLQSDGRLVYEATETMPDGSIGTVVYTKEGPCVVIQTTTSNHLHPENETRVFPLYIDESEEQTRRIISSVLKESAGRGPSTEEREGILAPWRDAVRLLEPAEVIIPYAERIELPSSQIRIRRDVRRLLDVVRVRAWLHQRQREHDDKGRILASEEDFHAALALVEDSLIRAWQALTPAEEKVLEAVKGLPERKRKEGFKRKDLRVAGVSDQRAKEVLRSLAGTGYLDCDERKGPQGYTYTLAREAQKMNLGISLRPPSDVEDRGEATGLSDAIGRNDNRPIETTDLQGEGASGRSDDRQTEEDFSGQSVGDTDESEPRADDSQDDWREAYRREMERRLGPDWQSDSPGTLLKRLGWRRVDDWAPGDRHDVGGAEEAEWDPVVREILDEVCIYMPNSKDTQWYDVCIASDKDLPSLRDEHRSQAGLDHTSSSTSPRQMRDHMARMLPTLQAERLFLDPELTAYYGYESRRSLVQGVLYVERWEKGREEEGLWFWVALKPDQHVPTEEVEDHVWEKVRYIEGLTEGHYSPPLLDDGYEFG